MYSNGYACFDPNDPAAEARWCAEAESLEGDFVGRFREAAKAHRVHVVSTFLERAEPKPFNAALLIDPGGHSLLHHRKVHICDFDSPELACGRGSEFAACDIETVAGRVLACSAVLPQHFEKLRASSGWGGLAHPPRNTSAL